MFLPQLAIPTEIFRSPLKKSIFQAAAWGIQGIRISAYSELKPEELSETGIRQLSHYLKEPGLKVAAVQLDTDYRLANQTNLDEHIARLKSAMQLAASLKSQVVLFHLGPISIEPDSESRNGLIDILNDVAAWGNHLGVVPTLNASSIHSENIRDLFVNISTGRIAMALDPAAVLLSGFPISETIRTLHESIFHVIGHDCKNNGHLQGTQTAIGQGDVDWLELLALLHEINFREWITVDYPAVNSRLSSIQAGIEYLKNLAGGHGF